MDRTQKAMRHRQRGHALAHSARRHFARARELAFGARVDDVHDHFVVELLQRARMHLSSEMHSLIEHEHRGIELLAQEIRRRFPRYLIKGKQVDHAPVYEASDGQWASGTVYENMPDVFMLRRSIIRDVIVQNEKKNQKTTVRMILRLSSTSTVNGRLIFDFTPVGDDDAALAPAGVGMRRATYDEHDSDEESRSCRMR